MSSEKTYNGWTNYETWAVKLWMDNEEPSYLYWKETAQKIWDDSEADKHFTKEERAAIELADFLNREHEEGQPDLGATVWHDLLNAALSDVNWREIAESLLGEVDNTADEPEDG